MEGKLSSTKFQKEYFDLKKIHNSGQVLLGWSELGEGEYSITSGRKKCYAREVASHVEINCPEEEVGYWKHYFDLETDYKIMEESYSDDTYLHEALAYGRGIRILNQDLWETMVSFIVSQNNNIPRISKSLKEIQGERDFFPTAEEMYEEREKLKNCGLGYRDAYLIKLLEELKIGSRSLCFDKQTEDAYKELISVYGIGPKVANCILLFGLHHMNCCPVDTWMKKVFSNHYEGKVPEWTKDKNAGYYQQVTFFYERNQ